MSAYGWRTKISRRNKEQDSWSERDTVCADFIFRGVVSVFPSHFYATFSPYPMVSKRATYSTVKIRMQAASSTKKKSLGLGAFRYVSSSSAPLPPEGKPKKFARESPKI